MFSPRFSLVFKRFVYRRTTDVVKTQTESANDLMWKTIENHNIKSIQDWKKVRNEILNNSGVKGSINSYNIDAMTVGICLSKKAYDLASSYFNFLESEQIKPNLATIGKYLKLLYLKGCEDGLTSDNEKEILMLYNNIRKRYPVLDAVTLDKVIQAMSLTSEWKECLNLLNEIKITSSPTSTTYSAIISAAFLNHEEDLGWMLFSEMLEQDKIVQGTVYSSYLNSLKTCKKTEMFKKIEKLFYFLQKHSLKFDSEALSDLAEILKVTGEKLRTSTINQRGICKCCKSKLEPFDLTETEFNELKHKIIQNVIVGKDVFNKTTPEELKKFENFISKMECYDVVVDGLNVAYSTGVQHSPLVTSGLVASVVSHFVKQDKKVLLLGRSHMNNWPKQNWGYVLQNATVFLTQNLSQDDPYLLYCALNSGRNTIIITKDLMRSHKFLLKNVQLKLLFDRWLSLRQYQLIHVRESGAPIFKLPASFSNVAQKNGNYWHIPYSSNIQNKSSISNAWLLKS